MEQSSQNNTAQNFENTTLVANNIQWYSSDKTDKSIIAYGVYCQNPKPTDSKKGDDFKIVYKNKKYLSYKKVGKKFVFLHEKHSLNNAQIACI